MAQGSPSSLFFGASYPEADYVIIVSPTTLLDTNRYVCEICHKGFPRKQNLNLHQRAHNLPFTLKTRTSNDPVPRKVYLCPEPTCVHHNRSHALGDFGGLRKHYLRKHSTERNHKCDNCSKAYSVETDLKAHIKICGKRKYICHCGCCFSRAHNFNLHQEHCVAPKNVDAANNPQKLNIGDNGHIGSVVSNSPTLAIRDDSIGFNSNENNYSLIGSQISSIQNQSNSYHPVYQYQLSQFGEHHSSLMTNPSTDLNISNSSAFFSSSATQPNQHEYQMKTDIGFYADLLTDKIPLESVKLEDVRMVGSNSFSNGSFMYAPSNSLNMAPAMHNNTNEHGMLNPGSGFSSGGSYGHGSYYGYGNYGSGQYDHGGGMEACNFETSAAAPPAEAPSGPHLNQHGFWF